MLVFISIILLIIIAIPVVILNSKTDPKTGKVRFPRTFKEWLGVFFVVGVATFLMFMHDFHEDLLGQIYTYIGVIFVIMWGIAIVFFGANPWKK